MESKIFTKKTVCVFDSGIGGLNFLYQCKKIMPYHDYVYVADNYNVPYGNLKSEEILSLAIKAFDVIESFSPSAAVIACNTVTAECASYLRSKYTFPIIGIEPAIKPASKVGGRCLVLATNATAKSKAFARLIDKYGNAETLIYPCTELAKYIEDNIFSLPKKLPDGLLPNVKADSVVLGCTHYSFVKNSIADRYSCPVFDGIDGTVDHLRKILGICNHREVEGEMRFIMGDFNKNRAIFALMDTIM